MITLYRKYRPQKIEDLDISEVRDSLARLVKSGKFPQALLFSGPKGTGKTSAARIFAKVLNCENEKEKPCGKCDQCVSIENGNNIDVIEIDAASYTGVDNIREIRDAAKLAPAKAKKKVYIIDEAHMLSTGASNALLKTLEEPPEHVTFILATTNPEKLIGTIRSRTANINFRKANNDEIARSLTRVASGEKIKIPEASLHLIAKYANGSFRDAVKTVEQMLFEERSFDEVEVENFLFKSKNIDIDSLIASIVGRDIKTVLELIAKATGSGVRPMDLAEELVSSLRKELLAHIGIGEKRIDIDKKDLISLVDTLTDYIPKIKTSVIEELPLELAIIKWCEGTTGSTKIETEVETISKATIILPEEEESSLKVVRHPAPEKEIKLDGNNLKELPEQDWRDILTRIKPINTSMEALLRAAKPLAYDGKTLQLGVYYRFHKERLEETHHRKILEDVVASVVGTPIRICCMLTEPPERPIPTTVGTTLTEGKDKDIIQAAEEIFGN